MNNPITKYARKALTICWAALAILFLMGGTSNITRYFAAAEVAAAECDNAADWSEHTEQCTSALATLSQTDEFIRRISEWTVMMFLAALGMRLIMPAARDYLIQVFADYDPNSGTAELLAGACAIAMAILFCALVILWMATA